MTTNAVLRLKRGLAANWTAANPVLDHGEPGYESDTGQLKFGDGDSNWNDLSYFSSAVGSHDHNDLYFTEAEVTALLAGKSDTGHDHNADYYTEAEVDGLLAGKSDTAHLHDDRYYTEGEVDGLIAGLGGGGIAQIVQANLSSNVSTTSASFVDLLTQAVTLANESDLIVIAEVGTYNASVTWNDFDLEINGDTRYMQGEYDGNTDGIKSTGVGFWQGLAAGLITVRLRWKVSGGTAYCNAASGDGRYMARMTIIVVEGL